MDSEDRKTNDHSIEPRHSRNSEVPGLSAKEEFASIIHEISEPVTAAALNAKAVQRALASEPPDLAIAGTALQCLIRDSLDIVEIVTQLHALFRSVKPDSAQCHQIQKQES